MSKQADSGPIALGALGRLAASSTDLDRLLAEGCAAVATGLGVSHTKVLQYLPDEKRLLVRAGLGWRDGVVGTATLGADLESPAGFALQTGKPTIANDLDSECRFRVPQLLAEHGVRSAVNAIVRANDRVFGVLEADSRDPREFDERDVQFIQGYADVLALAWMQSELAQQNFELTERLNFLMRELQHRTKNNNQMLLALIALQKRESTLLEVNEALDEIGNRINVLNHVDRIVTYDIPGADIDLGRYLMSIVEGLLRANAERAAQIKVTSNIEPLAVSTDHAQPLGMIVNEFITNSCKYAFVNGEGTLEISLARRDDLISLEIGDDGPGFNADEAKGLGLRIIEAMGKNLGARITWAMTAGTRLEVRFPAKAAAAPEDAPEAMDPG